MGQIQWTVALVLIGLFAIAIIGFAISFADVNNAAVDISDDPEISNFYSSSVTDLDSFSGDSADTYTSIVINSSISEEGQTTQTAGQFAITPTSIIGVAKNILEVGYKEIFGSEGGFNIFLYSFLGLIVLIMALLLWKTWAGRIPD